MDVKERNEKLKKLHYEQKQSKSIQQQIYIDNLIEFEIKKYHTKKTERL